MYTFNKEWLINSIEAGAEIKFCFFWGHRPGKDGQLTESCFSQWWESPFVVDGVTYRTAEHWMMAEKARLFNDHGRIDAILAAPSPGSAKALGREIENFDETAWHAAKFDIVVTGNYHKFSQHPNMQDFLLQTGDKVIVEASPVDRIWGIGLAWDHADAQIPARWRGENLLGFALMEVRRLMNSTRIFDQWNTDQTDANNTDSLIQNSKT